jgi:hypothetical protein
MAFVLRLIAGTALFAAMPSNPAQASTYFPQKVKCPVGGQGFEYMALASISQWGALPDGMPLGSGVFPTEPPRCPGNALVMYRDFTPEEVKTLTSFVKSVDYRALVASGETTYYLAWRTATVLGDDDAIWLLLRATWEAKNIDPGSERAIRYNREFVAAASLAKPAPASLEAVALRVRHANALRELGRFDEAQALLGAIAIPDDLGGSSEDAIANRAGWKMTIASLGAVVARQEQSRSPIDMMDGREAASRCLAAEIATKHKMSPPPPLTAHEQSWCARDELAPDIARLREYLAN